MLFQNPENLALLMHQVIESYMKFNHYRLWEEYYETQSK
jgi:hypothetical protein